jgi:hypothetical protein
MPEFNKDSDYIAQLGRIGGKLLAANLLRDGRPLNFRVNSDLNGINPLLHLDTEHRRVGVNTDQLSTNLRIAPNNLLGSSGTTKTINLEILENLDVDNLIFNQNGNISSLTGPIIISPNQALNPYIEFQRLITDDLEINDNYIKNTKINGNIELSASGTGKVLFNSDSIINGNLDVIGNIEISGDLSKQGDLILGNEIVDTVIVQTNFSQTIKPGDNEEYDLGSVTNKWRNAYINEPYVDFVAVSQFININNRLAIDGNNRSFTTLQINDNLIIDSNTGITQIERIEIEENEIRNLDSTPLIFSSTGIGYYRFAGTNGFVIPAGTTAERVGNEVGETRWNRELGYLECFDGNIWIISTGPGATINPDDMQELGQIYSLILG